MSSIQHKPKHKIYAGEFLPVPKSDLSVKELSKRATEWLRSRGLAGARFNKGRPK